MSPRFKVGDIVSRDGDDQHIVEEVNPGGDLIRVRCVKEPEPWEDGTVWCKLGETEDNLARRYTFAMRSQEGRSDV